MLQKNSFEFLAALKQNNHREWFNENRKQYEATRADFLALTEQLIAGVSAFDERIAAAALEPKQCVTRINRDVRFSKDKSPYKTNLFCWISFGGKNSAKASYYFQFAPEASFAGGGVYMPMPADLKCFRQEVDYNFEEFQAILDAPEFKATFAKGLEFSDVLSRPPKGYEKDNPALEWLKRKDFFTTKPLTDAVLQSPEGVKNILQAFHAAKPSIDFLNRALD